MPDSVTLLLSGTTPAFNIARRNTHSQKRANGEKAKGREGQFILKGPAETPAVMPALVAGIHVYCCCNGKP